MNDFTSQSFNSFSSSSQNIQRDKDQKLVLQIGEVAGKKELIELTLQ